MATKILDRRRAAKPLQFMGLLPTDIFEASGQMFMKLDVIHGRQNAMNLRTGKPTRFEAQQAVVPLNAEIVVND